MKLDRTIKHRLIRQVHFLISKPSKNDILFCGDSHVELFNYNLLKCSNYYNYGISGEKISGLIKRINHILYSDSNQLFVTIGTNDILANHSQISIQNDLDKLFFQISKSSSKKNIYFFSIYPFGKNRNDLKKVIVTNNYIKLQCSKFNYNYLNVYDFLKNENGFLDRRFSDDGLHLNIIGQNLISRILDKYSVCND